MKPWIAGVLALVLGAGGGYWVGHGGLGVPTAQEAAPAATANGGGRKLLYYRNPMGLPDTSPVPKKDSMGMDYIPVYEGEQPADAGTATQVSVSPEKVQQLGVRTEAVAKGRLERSVRAAARVEIDERRVSVIAPRFEGFIERLLVNTTGQPIAKGQALAEVYSPELVSLQREYAIAAQGVVALQGADSPAQQGMGRLVESSLQRLRNWELSEDQISALTTNGKIQRTVTLRSPAGGVVLEKKALPGMRFMPGEMLYQVADLSSVWVVANVAEQDLGALRLGSVAQVSFDAWPGERFSARVATILPLLEGDTRTVPVRLELANPGLRFKPAMSARVEFHSSTTAEKVLVPLSAVIDSGARQQVLVERAAGRFEPRTVRLGERNAQQVVVLEGLEVGERVVVSANFLIDAESNLKAALSGLQSAEPAPTQTKAVSHQASATVDSLNPTDLTVMLSHAPVASLGWPAMTMEFKLANAHLAQGLHKGQRLRIEFVERGQGEWVVTRIQPE